MTYRKSYFAIDGIDCGIYEGYTKGESWNGWDCPYLPTAPANRLLLDLKGQAGYDKSHLDEKNDVAITSHDGGETDRWEGMDITVDGETIHVYPIGTYAWIWQEVKNVQEFEHDDYFCGRVLLSYAPTDSGDYLDVEVWVQGEITFYWSLTVSSKGINNHEDLLREIKKPEYETEGCSVSI